MELNEYQKQAMTTCMVTCDNIAYMAMNLCGEVGELHSKLAKAIRKGKLFITTSPGRDSEGQITMSQTHTLTEAEMQDVAAECGDVLWQLAGVCSVLGFKLDDIGQQNLDKLSSRKQRHLIDGDGDNR